MLQLEGRSLEIRGHWVTEAKNLVVRMYDLHNPSKGAPPDICKQQNLKNLRPQLKPNRPHFHCGWPDFVDSALVDPEKV